VIGEHGDGSVPLFQRVRVAGEPVALDAGQRRRAEDFLRGWYQRHVALDSGRTSTWTSGLGLARMVEAIRAGGGADPWPASVGLRGEYGIEGICLGVPVELGREGVHRILEWELTEAESASMQAAAATVRAATNSISDSS
jgi:malate dehydrogenase